MNSAPLETLADLVNPLLGVTVLIAAATATRRRSAERPAWRFIVGTVAGLAVVYAVHNLDAHFHLWAQFGLDYSTHSAVAVSLVTSLAVGSLRRLVVLLPVLVGYGWLMAHLGYHTLGDMLSAAMLAAPTTWLCHRFARTGDS